MNALKIFTLFFFLLMARHTLHAQQQHNYDENKVPDYVLPPLLQGADRNTIKTTRQWENSRRMEIFQLFEQQVYGKVPDEEVTTVFQTTSLQHGVLGGKADRKEVQALFMRNKDTVDMNILIYLPNSADGPVPVFLGLNFYGNHTTHNDPAISIHSKWARNNDEYGIQDHIVTEKSRGVRSSRWQVEYILNRGYGLATIYYGDLFPDHAKGAGDGVQELFNPDHTRDSTSWGAITTWAWGLSKAMDYFENDADIDQAKVIVMGHSRLGKTALWAGARDKRFAAVISNNSGCGGAALFRRKFGETVGIINNSFPHWFCKNFHRFNNGEDNLPIDQHMLIALMAPRPIYVASAEEDLWADPKGEFLSAYHASEVYRLYGLQGITTATMPPVNEPISSTHVGYHIRSGGHNVTRFDWERFVDFADLHIK